MAELLLHLFGHPRVKDVGQCPLNTIYRKDTHLVALLPQSPGSSESDCHLIPAGKVDSDMVFLKHENRMAQEAHGIKRAGPAVCNLGERVQIRREPCLSWSRFLLNVVYNKLKCLKIASV